MNSENSGGNPEISDGDGSGGRYPFREIEAKWRRRWSEASLYQADENSDRPKYYVLTMFPYPSGSGLHVGHGKNYIPGDVVARQKHMQGSNVLHPMGWDAFGQPAEQDAIKRGVNPKVVVPALAAEYKRQLQLLGIGYDWSREINSTDPEYYRWNQWIFLQLYKMGLAYRKSAPVNWCVNESTVLANEEVVDGKCWRCDGPVVQKDLPQWLFRITAYADKLLEGLDKIDWPEGIKTQQRDWIGRSEGVEFDIPVEHSPEKVRVFTTRVDTVFGMSFIVLSPEHPLVDQITTRDQKENVSAYRHKAARLTDEDRQNDARERTGVFTGAHATNPVSKHRIPIYVADYVLMGYGTGAIMAVPAHDARDFDFARRYDLPTPVVIARDTAEAQNPPVGDTLTEAFVSKDGVTVNSGDFSGLPCAMAARRIAEWMKSEGIGVRKINYRLRDWLVSRQRYWGTPIPIVHCKNCGIVPVPEDELPIVLPDVENYQPGPDGRSPLASIPEFVNTICPNCEGTAERETDTMAGSVDSSWYFLRFTSPNTQNAAWDPAAANYWMPIDLYIGGREHAVGHLLYSRFFTKVFHDAGLLAVDEPAIRLRNQGMLLGLTAVDRDTSEKKAILPGDLVDFDFAAWTTRFEKEGAFVAERRIKDPETGQIQSAPVTIEFQWLKMSKSKGNAVTPDEIAEKFGADALRLYILFEAPCEDTIQWSEERMSGTFRFLGRVWDAITAVAPHFDSHWPEKIGGETGEARNLRRRTHQTILKVTDYINNLRFNTAVSALMVHTDALRKFLGANPAEDCAAHEAAQTLVQLLAPFAPHIADELWEQLGHSGAFLYNTDWPSANPEIAAADEITLIVQVNGKLRDRLTLSADADTRQCEMAALESDKIKEALGNLTIKKVIVVPKKLVNIVAG